MESDETLPGMGGVRRTRGRTERAVAADLAAARRRDVLPPDTAGLSALARVLARALDLAEHTGRHGMTPHHAARLLDVYRALGLVTEGKDPDDAALSAFVATVSGA